MSIWSKWYRLEHVFRSPLCAADCRRNLCDAEPTFGDSLNPNLFEVKPLADGQMLLIFKGKQFSKAIRTQYLASFADVSGGCVITLQFHQELLGMPPMTTEQEIVQFLGEKLRAIPVST